MKKLLWIAFLTLFLNPLTAKASFTWVGSDHGSICKFKCNNGPTSCPEWANASADGGCSRVTFAGGEPSLNTCQGAATNSCGAGNYFVDWHETQSPNFDWNSYNVLEVSDPDGNVYSGDDASAYLKKRFGSTQPQK